MSVTIVLDQEEMYVAAVVGLRRELTAMTLGRKDAFTWQRDGWRQHIEAAMAELAVSRAINRAWTGIPLTTFHGADVSVDVQVRHRPNPQQPDLSVDKDDADSHVYVLVHGWSPLFTVVGWCYGHEAKAIGQRVETDGGPIWFVRPDQLHEMPSTAKVAA